ncbi:MAG: tyrosine-type recombinase/integrase [Sedimenticola sp.]
MRAVEAVKTKEDIQLVEHLFRKHYGELYADLWRIGVNMALRISDLLAIRYKDIDLDQDKPSYELKEGKTGKIRRIRINETAKAIIEKRRKAHPTDTYLFQVHSNRTSSMDPKPVSRFTVAKRFKDVGETVGVPLGTHSMRKSRGWAMHNAGVPIEKIAMVLNHSTPAVTMRYLGITDEEVQETYEAFEL